MPLLFVIRPHFVGGGSALAAAINSVKQQQSIQRKVFAVAVVVVASTWPLAVLSLLLSRLLTC